LRLHAAPCWRARGGAGQGQAFGAEAKSLADIVASFDRERERRHVSSISVALVEAGRISLLARGTRNAARGEHAGAATRYQAASISKTIAAMSGRAPWPE
jgi:CubicO group peptidase (beta-lactamase class C family)